MTERGDQPDRGGWWLALLALPVLCCAGPAVLAALGAGSAVLVSAGLLLGCGAAAVLAVRRRRRTRR